MGGRHAVRRLGGPGQVCTTPRATGCCHGTGPVGAPGVVPPVAGVVTTASRDTPDGDEIGAGVMTPPSWAGTRGVR